MKKSTKAIQETSSPSFDPRLRYTIPEASSHLKQSRAKTFADIKAGNLSIIKDGRRTYIPGTEIIRRSSLSV